MADFEKALRLILTHEGGYVNDPDDPGGETYRGIARKKWPGWSGWTIIDMLKTRPGFPGNLIRPDEVEIIHQLEYEVGTFYHTQFWRKVGGELITDQRVAESVFDFAINAGISTSITLAQSVTGAVTDGVAGPKTCEAINRFPADHFLAAFAVAKICRYVEICRKRPESKKYFFGWVIRALNIGG
jgi:lysozyme family protein